MEAGASQTTRAGFRGESHLRADVSRPGERWVAHRWPRDVHQEGDDEREGTGFLCRHAVVSVLRNDLTEFGILTGFIRASDGSLPGSG